MSERFLDKVIAKTRGRVEKLKQETDLDAFKTRARQMRRFLTPHTLHQELAAKDQINIIAEIKRASPSKGVINADIDVVELAAQYQAGGAAAISVLTEPEYFGGDVNDIRLAFRKTSIPLLRKDFIIDDMQIYESANVGASSVLLIVAALTKQELIKFLRITRNELGMDALVEVHNREELKIAQAIGADIIGINNRNLQTLEISLDVSRDLIKHRPPGALMVAESGISTREEIEELKGLGFNGFLIGETLMRTGDPAAVLREWI